MLPQQFQHAHVLPYSSTAPMAVFQPGSQFAEDRGEFPIAVHVRVIQGRRTPGERRQIMPWIENLVARFVTANMPGHDLIVMDDGNAIDVAFDGHSMKGTVSRNAVRHVVKAGELVLVDLHRLADAGLETMRRQRSRLLKVLLEPLADGLLRIA